jgi:hypothetical protein
MSFVTIKAEIKTILEGIADIQEVFNFDKGTFGGYPAAVVFPSENSADYETTIQNRRQFVFTIRLHQSMEKTGASDHEKADRILSEVTDQVLDEFDKKFTLNGAVNFCLATPSLWGYQTRESGVVRVAETRLTCVKLVSIV